MSGTQPLAGRVQRPRTAGFAKPTVRAFLWTVLVLVGVAFALQSVPAMAQLTVNASGSPLSGVAPLTVNFTSTVSGGTLPYTWAWDFGDGGAAAVQNPQYVYNTPGTYMVNLLVVDANGLTGVATLGPIVVFLPVEVIANQTCGEAYLNVCFSANPGGTPPYSYTWDFGDGTFPTPNVNDPLPCHTFTTPTPTIGHVPGRGLRRSYGVGAHRDHDDPADRDALRDAHQRTRPAPGPVQQRLRDGFGRHPGVLLRLGLRRRLRSLLRLGDAARLQRCPAPITSRSR